MDNSKTISAMEENENLSSLAMLGGSSCSEEDVLLNSLEEESVLSGSTIVGPTTFSARPRTVSEIFPWLITIRNSLNLNLESDQAQRNVLPIMENYLRFIKNDLHTCYRYPNRSYILSKNITKMLLLFKDINKNFVDSHEYLVTLCDLLGIYTSLELKYATKFEEPKMLVANRIVLNYETHLQSIDRSYILRIFISIQKFFLQKEVMCKIFEKYLKHNRYTQQEFTDKIYVMYLIAFKYWRSLEDTEEESSKIDEIANSFMRPSPQLRRNTYYAPFIPPYTTDNDATKFILSHHFNTALLVKAFYSEERHCNDNTSMNRIINLSINEDSTNMNHIDLTATTSNKTLRPQMSNVKLENPEVIAIIDLTAEDQLRKQELYWLNNLIQKARSSKPIHGLHVSKNIASNIVDIIDLDSSDDDESMHPKSDTNNKQANEMNNHSSLLDQNSLKNIETESDKSTNPEKTLRSEQRNVFDDNKLSHSNTANLTQPSLGENKFIDENNEISLKKSILAPANKSEVNLNQKDMCDNILFDESKKEHAAPIGKLSINIRHDDNEQNHEKSNLIFSNETADNLKGSSSGFLTHKTELTSTNAVKQIEERSKHDTNIFEKDVTSGSILESCKNIENTSTSGSISESCNNIENTSAIPVAIERINSSIDQKIIENESENSISHSTHIISNILNDQSNLFDTLDDIRSSQIKLNDSLNSTNLDNTVTEPCKELIEENCNLNKRSENGKQSVSDNQKEVDSVNTCMNKDNVDILNLNKTEKISVDDANTDLALNLKSSFHLNNEVNTENDIIMDTETENESTNETELNLLQEHKSALGPLGVQKHSDYNESDSIIIDDTKSKPRSTQLGNDEAYCTNVENNTFSNQTKFVTQNCSLEEISEISNIKAEENESNINMQIKNFLENTTFSDDHNNVEKNPTCRTADSTKSDRDENEATLSNTTSIQIPEVKDTVDPVPFSTSSDSDLLSILYESDQLDDDNSDLNASTNKDIDDIPIDKISPTNSKATHGKSSIADNVIFSTTTNTRSSLPLSKVIDVKTSSKNSNVVFSTSKQKIARKENSVAMQNQRLNDNWIDPAIDFVDNSIGLNQNEIVSPPMEAFTKSDKTLFETFMNNVTETTAVKNVRFKDDLMRTKLELHTKESNSLNRPKSSSILTNTGPLSQHDVDDNFKLNTNILQIKKSVKFRDFPQEAADKTTKSSDSSNNAGNLIKSFATAAQIPGKERWATVLSTYNSEIDNTNRKPPTTSHQPIYSTINMKTIRPVTPRTSDADKRHRKNINNVLKLDKKIFDAQVCLKRIDKRIKLPLLKNQTKNKKNVRKSLSDFDRYLIQKKLEKQKEENKQLSFARNIISSQNKKKVQSTKGKHAEIRKKSYELKKPSRSKKIVKSSNSNINIWQNDNKLQKKVTVQLEDIASNPEYSRYFKGKHTLLKQPIFLGTHVKSKSLDDNSIHNLHLHLGENHAFHKAQTTTTNAAAILRKRRNTIAPEIVVHVFKDSEKKDKVMKLRNSDANVSKKFNHDLNESSLKTCDQNQEHLSMTHISNGSINYINYLELFKTISGSENIGISALSENILHTSVCIPKLRVKNFNTTTNDFSDRDYDPVPKINIKPNYPPEPDKDKIQTIVDKNHDKHYGNSSIAILNNDNENSLNGPSYSIENISNKKTLIENELPVTICSGNSNSSNSDCISPINTQDMNQGSNSLYFERDDEVTSTQSSNTRNKILTCDNSSTIISLTQTDVQNDQVDTSSLTDSKINFPRGRRKSMNSKSTNQTKGLYSGAWPMRRKTLSEVELFYRYPESLEDIVNMPSTTTIFDPPRRKRGRPKGSKNKPKNNREINEFIERDKTNKKSEEYKSTKFSTDDVLSVSRISNSSRESDNEPLANIRKRLVEVDALS